MGVRRVGRMGGGGGGSSTLAGDVTGPSGSNVVSSLRGTPLSSSTPSPGDVLYFNGADWGPVPFASIYTPVVNTPLVTYVASATDAVVVMNSSEARSAVFPASAQDGQMVTFKDGSGTASSAPVVVSGSAGDTVDGQSSVSIESNYGAISAVYDLTNANWVVV